MKKQIAVDIIVKEYIIIDEHTIKIKGKEIVNFTPVEYIIKVDNMVCIINYLEPRIKKNYVIRLDNLFRF